MKKITYLPILLLVSLLSSCKNPAFQAGGWIAPTLTLVGAVIFGFKTVKAKDYNVFKNGNALYCVCLLIATVVIFFMMKSDA
jgi:hypothetical protein